MPSGLSSLRKLYFPLKVLSLSFSRPTHLSFFPLSVSCLSLSLFSFSFSLSLSISPLSPLNLFSLCIPISISLSPSLLFLSQSLSISLHLPPSLFQFSRKSKLQRRQQSRMRSGPGGRTSAGHPPQGRRSQQVREAPGGAVVACGRALARCSAPAALRREDEPPGSTESWAALTTAAREDSHSAPGPGLQEPPRRLPGRTPSPENSERAVPLPLKIRQCLLHPRVSLLQV